MTVRPNQFVDGTVLTYLDHQIGSGKAASTKNALQDLCALYRRGSRIRPDSLYAVRAKIVGISELQHDAKVQRWVLNALAQVGNADCCKTVIRALESHPDDPEIITAGVAALYKISPLTAETDLRRLNFPGQMVTLAALQHVRPDQLNLSALPVNVQTADAETIKAALLVVGLDRAPPHLFDPDYSNAELVKVVGRHDDRTVSQYSVWAITENAALSISDLGINLSEVGSRPDNVRGWVYRLVAMSELHTRKHLDFIDQSSQDESVEARVGLARGLKDTFFDGLSRVVLDWFTREEESQVQQELLDHLVTNSGRSLPYHEHAIEAYKRAGLPEQERMRSTAIKTPLFPEFRKIDVLSGGDLFMTNNTFNFQNSPVGAVSGSGMASNTGQCVHYDQRTAELLKTELDRAATTIDGLAIPEAEKREAADAIKDAKADTNTGTVRRVTSALTKAAGVVTAVAGAEDTLNQIVQGISKLAGLS